MDNLDSLFRTLFFGLALLILWLLLDPAISAGNVAFGLISVSSTLVLFHTMFNSAEHYYPRILRMNAVGYLFWLVKEAITAAATVCRMILSRRVKTSASFVTLTFRGKSDVFRSFLAHSITLTPGTVSVLLVGKSKLIVHSLTDKNTENLQQGEMQNRLLKLEGQVPIRKGGKVDVA